MAVNSNTWRKFAVADRDQSFNADHAIKRIAQASAGSVETFNMAFLWRDSNGPPNNKNSYRLPVVDVIGGKFVLIPHAVFTAAAILSGAHGGLVGVVGDEEKKQLRSVVTQIYDKLRDMFSDERIVPPWEREDVPPQDRPNRQISASGVNVGLLETPLVSVAGWSAEPALHRMWEWAGGDYRQYRRGFVWGNPALPETRHSYRIPVGDIVDGQLVVTQQGVAAAAASMAIGADNSYISDYAFDDALALVAALQARSVGDVQQEETMTASGPLRPPADWFDDPLLDGPTPLEVTADGRVRGHLALWNVCHFSFQDQCRMAPRSPSGYQYFQTGSVLTADGSQRRVGRITVGTGHANLRLGYVPAADHYDNTGTGVAVVAAGEDMHGIWVAGAVAPGVPEVKVAELRRSPLSGDWRPTQSGLELVAALAVNTPGFPIVGFNASGEVQSLVAAGMVLRPEEIEALGVAVDSEPVPVPDDALLKRLDGYQEKAAKLTRRVLARRLDDVLRSTKGGV